MNEKTNYLLKMVFQLMLVSYCLDGFDCRSCLTLWTMFDTKDLHFHWFYEFGMSFHVLNAWNILIWFFLFSSTMLSGLLTRHDS